RAAPSIDDQQVGASQRDRILCSSAYVADMGLTLAQRLCDGLRPRIVLCDEQYMESFEVVGSRGHACG
ncbi:MAG: hypothetical protein JWN04_2490, partial [Myxococcaceae bacterium]|nr:hypothetical protein [Myxococcaceae bacterium]